MGNALEKPAPIPESSRRDPTMEERAYNDRVAAYERSLGRLGPIAPARPEESHWGARSSNPYDRIPTAPLDATLADFARAYDAYLAFKRRHPDVQINDLVSGVNAEYMGYHAKLDWLTEPLDEKELDRMNEMGERQLAALQAEHERRLHRIRTRSATRSMARDRGEGGPELEAKERAHHTEVFEEEVSRIRRGIENRNGENELLHEAHRTFGLLNFLDFHTLKHIERLVDLGQRSYEDFKNGRVSRSEDGGVVVIDGLVAEKWGALARFIDGDFAEGQRLISLNPSPYTFSFLIFWANVLGRVEWIRHLGEVFARLERGGPERSEIQGVLVEQMGQVYSVDGRPAVTARVILDFDIASVAEEKRTGGRVGGAYFAERAIQMLDPRHLSILCSYAEQVGNIPGALAVLRVMFGHGGQEASVFDRDTKSVYYKELTGSASFPRPGSGTRRQFALVSEDCVPVVRLLVAHRITHFNIIDSRSQTVWWSVRSVAMIEALAADPRNLLVINQVGGWSEPGGAERSGTVIDYLDNTDFGVTNQRAEHPYLLASALEKYGARSHLGCIPRRGAIFRRNRTVDTISMMANRLNSNHRPGMAARDLVFSICEFLYPSEPRIAKWRAGIEGARAHSRIAMEPSPSGRPPASPVAAAAASRALVPGNAGSAWASRWMRIAAKAREFGNAVARPGDRDGDDDLLGTPEHVWAISVLPESGDDRNISQYRENTRALRRFARLRRGETLRAAQLVVNRHRTGYSRASLFGDVRGAINHLVRLIKSLQILSDEYYKSSLLVRLEVADCDPRPTRLEEKASEVDVAYLEAHAAREDLFTRAENYYRELGQVDEANIYRDQRYKAPMMLKYARRYVILKHRSRRADFCDYLRRTITSLQTRSGTLERGVLAEAATAASGAPAPAPAAAAAAAAAAPAAPRSKRQELWLEELDNVRIRLGQLTRLLSDVRPEQDELDAPDERNGTGTELARPVRDGGDSQAALLMDQSTDEASMMASGQNPPNVRAEVEEEEEDERSRREASPGEMKDDDDW